MIAAQKTLDRFAVFLSLAWKDLGLPPPTQVQLEIADFLQYGLLEHGRRIGVEAFRGVGKSWITSAFVCWLLLRNKEFKILVVSASKERADSFSTFTKQLLALMPEVQHLAARKGEVPRLSNIAFDVKGCRPDHSPSVKSVGITGQITGSRADYIICDDVEVVNNSETAALREKLVRLVAELGGAVLKPDAQAGQSGGVIYLGTPQVEDSLYNKLPDQGYTFRIWPAEVPKDPDAYRGALAPSVVASMQAGVEAGTPTDPLRFDWAELQTRRLEYGAIGYTLQFQLDTSLSDADKHPLKLRDFIVAETDRDIAPDKLVWGSGSDQEVPELPLVGLAGDRFYAPLHTSEEWSPYELSIMYVDPSGRGRDQTGYAVIKVLNGMLFIRRWGGLNGGYEEKDLVRLATIARDEKVNAIVVESNFGDGMFAQLLRPVLERVCPRTPGIEDDHVTGQKEARICDSLEPVLAQHRVVIDKAVVREAIQDRSDSHDHEATLKSPFFQLTRMSRDRGCLKYDDQIDALAGAIRYCTEMVGRDVDQEVEARKAERLDQLVDDFVNDVSVWKKTEPTHHNKDFGRVMRP